MRILITLISLATMLALPVEIYDEAEILVSFSGAGLTTLLVFWSIKQYFPEFKSVGVTTLIFLALLTMNGKCYYFRRERLFENNGKITTAEITKKETARIKYTFEHIIYYRYSVDGYFYDKMDEVDSKMFTYFTPGQSIKVDYVEGRPEISRININSLLTDPADSPE